ncbi:hypothetical protein [Natranaeroarchaeum sulfidigenes]|uniref:DUF7964 domain-containing protein n=1 Tax=Natranaeroarchaeum sulfidigenes TaxID=2784880 RepID=A0A897MTS9_9EURY|nr:hypothetical protein [Natranaeroarchaeum sulfidigenes]QSG03924.1 hypothetical protein AArcS_2728 [Natranaeroarchaeum sulfidigenes]
MVAESTLLDSFPDSPVSTTTLHDLEDHDEIRNAIPMMTQFQEQQEVADRVIVQTDSAAVVGAYKSDGWVLEHRIDAEGRDPESVLEEAMLQAQSEQGISFGAVPEDSQTESDPDSPDDM